MASVDIFIPCYNYARFLPQCVDSALAQGIEDIRIVIIDNASTDDSVCVARELARKDSRIELVCHDVNLGPHASFNEAIDLARRDYFLILCADDLLTGGSLRLGIDLLESHPNAAFVLGTHTESWQGDAMPSHSGRSGGGRITSGSRFIEQICLSIGEKMPAHAILVRTSIQKRAGHYRASLPYYDDLEMVMRLALLGCAAQLPGPLAVPRIHTTNLSASLWQNRLRVLREREAVFQSFFRREGAMMDGTARLRSIAMKRIGEAAYWSAISHLLRGRRAEGAELLRYAISLDPASRLLPPLGHLYRTPGVFKRAAAVVSEWLLHFSHRQEDHP